MLLWRPSAIMVLAFHALTELPGSEHAVGMGYHAGRNLSQVGTTIAQLPCHHDGGTKLNARCHRASLTGPFLVMEVSYARGLNVLSLEVSLWVVRLPQYMGR